MVLLTARLSGLCRPEPPRTILVCATKRFAPSSSRKDWPKSSKIRLGDHFLDDAISSAQLMVGAIANRDQDMAMRAAAANIRWQEWWNVHGTDAITALSTRYETEER